MRRGVVLPSIWVSLCKPGVWLDRPVEWGPVDQVWGLMDHQLWSGGVSWQGFQPTSPSLKCTRRGMYPGTYWFFSCGLHPLGCDISSAAGGIHSLGCQWNVIHWGSLQTDACEISFAIVNHDKTTKTVANRVVPTCNLNIPLKYCLVTLRTPLVPLSLVSR